jgi:hypothetical protein
MRKHCENQIYATVPFVPFVLIAPSIRLEGTTGGINLQNPSKNWVAELLTALDVRPGCT